MSTMTPVPTNHPLMIAWLRWRASDDYQNAVKWLLDDYQNAVKWLLHDPTEHADGELWAAFEAGFNAALSISEAQAVRRERHGLLRAADYLRERAKAIGDFQGSLPLTPREVAVLLDRHADKLCELAMAPLPAGKEMP